MSTATIQNAFASVLRISSALFQNFADGKGGSSELGQLYRMSRGSDSVRPAVNEHLARRAGE